MTQNHPISDRPSFFIHPCNTHEALLAVNESTSINAVEYLFLWLGVVGPFVGLYVPGQLVIKHNDQNIRT